MALFLTFSMQTDDIKQEWQNSNTKRCEASCKKKYAKARGDGGWGQDTGALGVKGQMECGRDRLNAACRSINILNSSSI